MSTVRACRLRRALYSRAMSRPKTISDESLLAVARKLFRAEGHAVSTREVAESAGISEAVLYQRFGNKDELFFAAMAPSAPDLAEVLGPEIPDLGAKEYLVGTAGRLADYFGEVLPLALRLITHPSFDYKSLGGVHAFQERLRQGLLLRLTWFEGRRRLRRGTAGAVTQLLISLAHDWALSGVMSPRGAHRRDPEERAALAALVELVWKGAAPSDR
jgi:AcrR family transcriptional regulator